MKSYDITMTNSLMGRGR